MNDATPRSLEALHLHATRYSVVLHHRNGSDRVVVGFTARATRQGLLDAVRGRGPEIVALTGTGEVTSKTLIGVPTFRRHELEIGDWNARYGDTERVYASGTVTR